jgi:3-dehydroquinate synthase
MKLSFRTAKATQIRFFSSFKAMKPEGFLFLDAGVPAAKFDLPTFALKAGEEGKRWRNVESGLEWLAAQKAERSQSLVVLGGGAALDAGAMVASLYRRGMRLVLVPTTLLAMVDATLGGKTAVDREGAEGLNKNFAGTFYPADEVWVCLDFLATLPFRERLSGAGEVWKTLWLAGKKSDLALVEYLASGKVSPALGKIVKQCLEVKKRFVEKDPLDTKRIRESLNYGHTIGHALESLAQGRLSHGEAVFWGMAAESTLLGRGGKKMLGLVKEKIRELGLELPPEFGLPAERWLPLLQADKKAKGGLLELTVLSAPGKLRKKKISPADLADSIKAFPAAFRP